MYALPAPHALPRSRADARRLRHSLLLAALLHLWLALTVGTQPSDAPSQGGWGRLTVTLLGPQGGVAGHSGPAAPVWRDDGPPGAAPTSRHGGRLRDQPAPADSEPGAQQSGRWRAQPVPADASRTAVDTPGTPGTASTDALPVQPAPAREPLADRLPPAPSLATVETPALPQPEPPRLAVPEPAAAPSRLERRARDERIEALPPAPAPPPLPLQTLPARAPALLAAPSDAGRVPRPSSEGLEALQPLPRPADPRWNTPLQAAPVQAPPSASRLEAPARPAVQRAERLNAVPLPVPAAPLPLAVPSRAPSLLETPERAAPPRVQTEGLAPAPDAAPALPTLRTAPERIELPASPLQESPQESPQEAPPSVRELPAAAVPRPRAQVETLRGLAPTAPPGADSRLTPPPREAPLSAVPEASPAAPAAQSTQTTPVAGDPLADPRATPGPASRASPGSPDAGARVGHDQATAPSASASQPLAPLNLKLPPRGQLAGPLRQSSGLVNLLPAPPLPKSKLEKALDEAGREDCRKAHADAGLLGALPLAVDSARGKGCRW